MRRPKGQEQKNNARVFGAVGLQPFLVFCVFVFLQKHCLSPEHGLFCSFPNVSLFSLASFNSPFSLSVSLFFVSCFFVPSLLSCFFVLPCFLLFFLALFLCFCFTKKEQHQILHFKGLFIFINHFCFLGFPVLSCLSNPLFCFCFFCSFSCVFWST